MRDRVRYRRRQGGNANPLIIVALLAGAIGVGLALVPQERWRQWFDQPATVMRSVDPAPQPGMARDGQYALVIGNTNYEYKRLVNPVNDARSMAELLRARGFEVDAHYDLNSTRLQEAVRAFGQRLRGNGAVGLVYFSGHGTEIDGENYLMPVDNQRIADQLDVRQYAVSLSYVLARLREADVPLKLVILDACRDDPFPDSGKSVGRGLGAFSSPNGTLIAYAAAPGKKASDNPNAANGLYTQHLLAALQQPGRRIEDVFIDVKRSVSAASNGDQEPWYNASLDSKYCLGGCESAPTPPPTPVPGPVPVPSMKHVELTVRPTPADARVRIMNIASVYQEGITLVPDDEYHIEVSAPGYKTYSGRHRFDIGPQELSIVLREQRILSHRQVIQDHLENGHLGPEMVFLSGGSFLMGSSEADEWQRGDEYQHLVAVNDVLIARTEVTVGEFRRFVQTSGYLTDAERNAGGANGCFGRDTPDSQWGWREGRTWLDPGIDQGNTSPVVCVSWNDAQAYVTWLSSQTGEDYRLPTEAEWEYAARAGTTSSRYWGNDDGRGSRDCGFANGADFSALRVFRQYDDDSLWLVSECDDRNAWTAPVSSYRPSPWGLSDMLGNVQEWTCSTYDAVYGGAESRCDVGSESRVVRGGAWDSTSNDLRAAARRSAGGAFRGISTGLRLARSP